MKNITEIKKLLDENKIIEVKKKLDELNEELEKLQTFFDEIKTVVRNTGRSSLISVAEIKQIIVKYEK